MKKNNEIVISAKNIHKDFYLPHENTNSLKASIVNVFKPKDKGIDTQHALKGITFEVKKGEFFGIVGRNGSGKSTLLKILAQIYQPSKGSVKTKGKLVPFIELGVGFNPELTGRENVYLNGALLGFSKDEIKEKYDEIVEFAELEEFMDQKLKNYSSGMQVRLAFSVAIQADGDILLLDEVLAVGDEAFQRKCNNYFAEIKKSDKTIVLVTHSMESVRRYCTKAILIKDGIVDNYGAPDIIADIYSRENLDYSNEKKSSSISSKVYIKPILKSSPLLTNEESVNIQLEYRGPKGVSVYPKIVLMYENTPIIGMNAKVLHNLTTSDDKIHKFDYSLNLKDFNKGEVNIVAILVDAKEEVNLASYGYGNELGFVVSNPLTGDKIGGIMKDKGKLKKRFE